MQTFDPNNGQVYIETTSNAPSMTQKWKRHINGRPTNPQTYRNPVRGASPLRDMALRSCCWNVLLMMPEALEEVGWWYAVMIYRQLKETDTLSFAAWSLFQQAFPGQTELQHHFSIPKQRTADSWPSIVDNLSNLNPSVTTLLSTPGLSLSLQHLLSLTAVPGLTALVHLLPPQPPPQPFSASDVRIWARAAQEKNALATLRVLVLSAVADDAKDAAILHPLSSLPALTLIGISRASRARPKKHDQTHRQHTDPSPWTRPNSTREQDLTAILHGHNTHADRPLAERTNLLHTIATAISNAAESQGPTALQLQLSLTCYGDGSLDDRSATDVAWYTRRAWVAGVGEKRTLDTGCLNSEEGVEKKRRVRQGKQQDVGAMLGLFG